MYCPKCGSSNGEEAKFCRTCGTNLSLVPEAITGHLQISKHGRRHDRESGLGVGITKLFGGLGFVMVALALGLTSLGRGWWYWMLIPAFASLGKGVAAIVTELQRQKQMASATVSPQPAVAPPAHTTGALPPTPADVQFPLPPPSVTETTTRHLDSVSAGKRESQ